MFDDTDKKVDKQRIKSSIRLWLPISITTYTLPRNMEIYMQDVLSAFLSECQQEHMASNLSYCLGELVTNAKKANTKRVYFAEKGLDINDPEDYEKGMKNFKTDTLENIGYYLELQKKAGLYVRLVLQKYRDKIKIEVHNNVELTIFEYKRIHDKLARAQKYQSVDEVLAKILDNSEGAGLGIVIIILMLEKIGLTEENYQVVCENGETITRIILPVNKETHQAINAISEEVVEVTRTIPVLQSSLNQIQSLLRQDDATIPQISKRISKDVSATFLVLQYVNDVMKIPCLCLPKAVELVGVEKLAKMFSETNPMIRIINNLDDEDNIWEHSARVAFFAFNIARNLAAEDPLSSEEIYVKGLLHDISRVCFTALEEKCMEQVFDFCKSHNISLSVFNSVKEGINHTYMGSFISKKWNFPDSLTACILFHHDPLLAPRISSKHVAIVYISDMMARYLDGSVDFYQIDKSVLRQFNIISEDKFALLTQKAEEAFQRSYNS